MRHKFIFSIKQTYSKDIWEINDLLDWVKKNKSETSIGCLRFYIGRQNKKYLVLALASIIQYCNEWLEDIKQEINRR